MRDRRGTLGLGLAKAQGEDLDKLLWSLRTQESPRPSGAPSSVIEAAVDVHRNSQDEMLSLEMKCDLSDPNLLLHNGIKVLLYLKESVRRNSTSTVAQSKTVDLFFAPVFECSAGVSSGVKEALVRDWVGRGPRATDSCRGQCRRGEPWGSGLPCHQKRPEVGVSEDEPSACLKARSAVVEPSLLHSVPSTLLPVWPEAFPSDKTVCVSLGRSEPMLSEQTAEYKRMPRSVKSTSNHLQIMLGILTVQAFKIATPLCHS
ncbi:protein FAM220A isoform X1 [Saccopteryx bilineata]|uniref:protein FAM220A isoform X1 n=1 Tax=Saccopteryx bilineata TaxID=59482 RepID=UPI0033901128